MLKIKSLALAAALCGAALPALAASTQVSEHYGAHLRASDGSVVRSGFGLCWRTGSWTPDAKDASCDTMVAVADIAPARPAEPHRHEHPEPAAAQRTVELTGTVHFVFDRDQLTAAGRELLDGMASQGQDAAVAVEVTGHADRIGSEAYNHGLAKRRAEAVARHLMSKGFAAEKVRVDERGESEPVVSCDNRSRRALIKCLAPNRRAEIVIRFAAE